MSKTKGLLAEENEFDNLSIKERLTLFSEVSEDYLKFEAREFTQKRQARPLQDIEKAVRFKTTLYYLEKQGGKTITFGNNAIDTGLYSAERMAKYIKGYNQDFDYKKYVIEKDKDQSQNSA